MKVNSPTSIVLLLTVCLLLAMVVAAWRFRTSPGSKLFGVLQALSAVWAALTLGSLHLPLGPMQLRIWGLSTGLSLLVGLVWFGFILAYTGRENLLTVRRFGAVSVPLVGGAGLYFLVPSWSPLVGQVSQTTRGFGSVVQASIGPLGGLLGIYIYALFFAGLALAVKTILENNSHFLGQGIALVLGSLITIAASVLAIIGVPSQGYPITAVALGVQSLFWGYAVFGQGLLQSVPAVATIDKRVVFDNLDNGVLVVNDSDVITRANPTVRSYLDVDDIEGTSVDRILDLIGISALAELPARFQFDGQSYRAVTSRITDWRGDPIGRTLVIQEVTQLVRRQQRLQVMNRILRHNVRNDMNVVRALGTRLERRDGDELRGIGETVSRKADDLIQISEKAVELDESLRRQGRTDRVDIESLLAEIASSLNSQYPDATVRLNGARGEVRTNERILSLVLTEVITNAVEHSGEAPEVTVDAGSSGEQFEIVVADQGPGIPQAEIDPITDGEETDLQHASSLGLWLVSWGVQALNGDIAFETALAGTTVTVSLPEM